jgi:hypothetical protein
MLSLYCLPLAHIWSYCSLSSSVLKTPPLHSIVWDGEGRFLLTRPRLLYRTLIVGNVTGCRIDRQKLMILTRIKRYIAIDNDSQSLYACEYTSPLIATSLRVHVLLTVANTLKSW